MNKQFFEKPRFVCMRLLFRTEWRMEGWGYRTEFAYLILYCMEYNIFQSTCRRHHDWFHPFNI